MIWEFPVYELGSRNAHTASDDRTCVRDAGNGVHEERGVITTRLRTKKRALVRKLTQGSRMYVLQPDMHILVAAYAKDVPASQ